MNQKGIRFFLLSCVVFVWLGCFSLPAFAAGEVYAVQVGTSYYQANAAGVQVSTATVPKEAITHLFADAYVVQVGREDERFVGCTNLQVIDFSSAVSLKIIYSETFKNCTSLHTVVLPAQLSELQSGAFRGCTALQSINLSGTAVTRLSNHVFDGCTALQTVAFPAALTQIDYYAFHGCRSLVLGDSLQSTQLRVVQNHAFYGCTGIVSVAMPATLVSLESNAFAQCANFATLALGTVPPSATWDTFAGCAQTDALRIDPSAVAAYQAAGDGNTTDLYWYGWLIQQTDVTAQLSLSISGWQYQEKGAPKVSLAKNGVALAEDVTYLYATAEDGTYQSLDALPQSNAGEVKAGNYWCEAIYDGASEKGSVTKAFTVTQRPITATIWVLGITKVYDGTTEIIGLQPTVVMEGGLAGDKVSATGKFAYADASAGEDKTIKATDLALAGADAANYTLTATVASENGAVITQKEITVPPPTASDINKGDTLADSTLTEGDMSKIDITGHWEWVDDTTQPEGTGKFPAVFVPDDDGYTTYGPVDVQVVVHEAVVAPGKGDDGASGDHATGGDPNGDGDAQGNENGLLGGLAGALGGLFGGQKDTIEDDEIPLINALIPRGSWALLNLLLCILAVAISVVMLCEYFYDRKYTDVALGHQPTEGDDFAKTKESMPRTNHLPLLSLIPAVLSLVFFLLTEDMLAPMRLVDRWTLVMVLFVLLQLVVVFCSRRKEGRLVTDYQGVFSGDAYLDGD